MGRMPHSNGAHERTQGAIQRAAMAIKTRDSLVCGFTADPSVQKQQGRRRRERNEQQDQQDQSNERQNRPADFQEVLAKRSHGHNQVEAQRRCQKAYFKIDHHYHPEMHRVHAERGRRDKQKRGQNQDGRDHIEKTAHHKQQ